MRLLRCPVNGVRPIGEFVWGGEVRVEPLETVGDREWAEYVFHREGGPGVKREWWCHTPSNTWFVAERDTLSDRVHRTYLWGEEHE